MICTWGQGDTTASLAAKLASAINSAAGSYVTTSANGTSVQLVSTGTGLGVNYAVSVSIADTQTARAPLTSTMCPKAATRPTATF